MTNATSMIQETANQGGRSCANAKETMTRGRLFLRRNVGIHSDRTSGFVLMPERTLEQLMGRPSLMGWKKTEKAFVNRFPFWLLYTLNSCDG
jgi:hypothetical protein